MQQVENSRQLADLDDMHVHIEDVYSAGETVSLLEEFAAILAGVFRAIRCYHRVAFRVLRHSEFPITSERWTKVSNLWLLTYEYTSRMCNTPKRWQL